MGRKKLEHRSGRVDVRARFPHRHGNAARPRVSATLNRAQGSLYATLAVGPLHAGGVAVLVKGFLETAAAVTRSPMFHRLCDGREIELTTTVVGLDRVFGPMEVEDGDRPIRDALVHLDTDHASDRRYGSDAMRKLAGEAM